MLGSENGEDGEVAELTAVTVEQKARSGTSWCCGEGEGDLRRPELGKKALPGLFQWLGVVLVECRGGVGSSLSSGPLFIGDPRGWP